MSTTEDFADLFAGRNDAWGSVEGRCVRERVTIEHYHRHLTGGTSLGIYPTIQSSDLAREWHERLGGPVGDNFVRWGCADIDNASNPEACWPLAANLAGALRALEITSWIERTKSKGYHVWVFADEWVPSIVMRRALLVAHQVAGVAPSEVNPKQVDVGKRVSLGNYVNLPYAHEWAVKGRRVVVTGPNAPVPLHRFVNQALATRASFDTLLAAAKLYREAPKAQRLGDVDRPTDENAERLARRLPGLAYKIWREGPLEGRDRSGTLTRLAHLCREADFSAADTLVLVRDADARWGKFHDRADCEERLVELIDGVWR